MKSLTVQHAWLIIDRSTQTMTRNADSPKAYRKKAGWQPTPSPLTTIFRASPACYDDASPGLIISSCIVMSGGGTQKESPAALKAKGAPPGSALKGQQDMTWQPELSREDSNMQYGIGTMKHRVAVLEYLCYNRHTTTQFRECKCPTRTDRPPIGHFF